VQELGENVKADKEKSWFCHSPHSSNSMINKIHGYCTSKIHECVVANPVLLKSFVVAVVKRKQLHPRERKGSGKTHPENREAEPQMQLPCPRCESWRSKRSAPSLNARTTSMPSKQAFDHVCYGYFEELDRVAPHWCVVRGGSARRGGHGGQSGPEYHSRGMG
jgi:hypothetical protein